MNRTPIGEKRLPRGTTRVLLTLNQVVDHLQRGQPLPPHVTVSKLPSEIWRAAQSVNQLIDKIKGTRTEIGAFPKRVNSINRELAAISVLLEDLTNATSREYYSFDGIDDYLPFPAVSFSDDFYLSVEVKPSSSEFYLFADDRSEKDRILIFNNKLYTSISDIDPLTGTDWLNDGLPHTLRLERAQGMLTLLVDGKPVTGGVPSTSVLTLNSFGNQWGASTGVGLYHGTAWNLDLNGEYSDDISDKNAIVNVNSERWSQYV